MFARNACDASHEVPVPVLEPCSRLVSFGMGMGSGALECDVRACWSRSASNKLQATGACVSYRTRRVCKAVTVC